MANFRVHGARSSMPVSGLSSSKYGGNTSEIGYGKRLSLTFNGALFGTYDPLWSPS